METEIQTAIQDKARELLTQKTVDLVIGYGQMVTGGVGPVFLTDPKDCGLLMWNDRCSENLTVYLKKKEVKKQGKIAIIVKGCDAKTLAVLEAEHQIDREKLVVIGVVCEGVIAAKTGEELAEKCRCCEVHNPLHCDVVIGKLREKSVSYSSEERYKKLEMLRAMSRDERLAYWANEFERCVKCFACRQACPLCYCEVCVADKNRPYRFTPSSNLKGNFAWHIVRAFHLAGRCVGCGACVTCCPVGIDLGLLNMTLAQAAEQFDGYRAGLDRNALPLIGTFKQEDQEEFIR